MDIKPLRERVLVKPMEAEERTASGIIIPDTAKEKPMKGEVIAVGTGKLTDAGTIVDLIVKPGDKVLYGTYSGIEIPGTEFLIMKESDIYGIIQ